MASVVKRGERWYAIVYPGNGKQKWIRLPRSANSRTAPKLAIEIQEKLDWARLGLSPSEKTSSAGWLELANAVLAEIESTASDKKRLGWLPSQKNFVARFALHIGDKPVARITADDCRQYQIARLQESSPSTVRKDVTFIASIFKRAIEKEMRASNPWDFIERPKEPPSGNDFISASEFDALVAAAPDARKLRYLLLGFTGCRPGEAIRMRWRNVDFEAGTIQIPNSEKGERAARGSWRLVPAPVRLLDALIAHRGEPNDLIFPEARFAQAKHALHRWLEHLQEIDCPASGVRRLTLKMFRASFATWAAFVRYDSATLRDDLDHANQNTTDRYIKRGSRTRGSVPEGFGVFLSTALAEGRGGRTA